MKANEPTQEQDNYDEVQKIKKLKQALHSKRIDPETKHDLKKELRKRYISGSYKI